MKAGTKPGKAKAPSIPARSAWAQHVVGAGLVGDHVRTDPPLEELREDLGRVAHQAHRQGPPVVQGFPDPVQRLLQIRRGAIAVGPLHPAASPLRVDLNHQGHPAVHRDRQRLGATHATQSGGQHQAPFQGAREVLTRQFGQGLIGALEDALGSDVDPGTRGHLPVHGQSRGLEVPELLPGRPGRNQVGVRDQHPGGPRMRLEDSDGLSRLHQQGLVTLQTAQAAHQGVIALPVSRRPAGSAIDHQLVGFLGHLGVQVVHEHAQGGFLLPAFAGEGPPPGSANCGSDRHTKTSRFQSGARGRRSQRLLRIPSPARVVIAALPP
jgi:hypothetical protein